MTKINLQRLCKRLDYQFKNIDLLKQALTHRSAGSLNNERFEFLGDSILNFITARILFERFPQAGEGQLSRLRSFLVKGEMLAEIAMELQLGDFLYLGQGELKSGGFRRASILADAFEAVVAAVFLDGNLEATEALILRLFNVRLENQLYLDNIKDAKTALQEYLQAIHSPLPKYKLIKIEGEEHQQTFYIACSVVGLEKTTVGLGGSRRKAEQNAAKLLLQFLQDIPL